MSKMCDSIYMFYINEIISFLHLTMFNFIWNMLNFDNEYISVRINLFSYIYSPSAITGQQANIVINKNFKYNIIIYR